MKRLQKLSSLASKGPCFYIIFHKTAGFWFIIPSWPCFTHFSTSFSPRKDNSQAECSLDCILFNQNYISSSGILECKVSIESHQNISSRTTDIYVLARPSVMISNYSYTLTEGEDISLRCVSTFEQTGHPNDTIPATILWYKNNVEIKPGDGNYISYLFSKLK